MSEQENHLLSFGRRIVEIDKAVSAVEITQVGLLQLDEQTESLSSGTICERVDSLIEYLVFRHEDACVHRHHRRY